MFVSQSAVVIPSWTRTYDVNVVRPLIRSVRAPSNARIDHAAIASLLHRYISTVAVQRPHLRRQISVAASSLRFGETFPFDEYNCEMSMLSIVPVMHRKDIDRRENQANAI